MKRLASLLFAASLLSPASVLAASPPDAFADAVQQASNQSFRPENALGAPDEAYLDFFSKDANVILDMGAGEEGMGDLTLYFKIQNFGAAYRVDFLDADQTLLQTSGNTFQLSQSSTVVSYSGAPYRFVRVTSTQDNQWSLDAIQAADFVKPGQANPPPAENPPPAQPPSTPRGLLVKLPDDGNPNTDFDSAVYEIGADGKRHAFPSFAVFNSWYANFDDVAFIDATNMASYALGPNVTVRPGTHLVKITTDPKVYAVEPGGVLRWVPSETVAVSLFGSLWAKRVIDVPDVFFHNYSVGPDLNDQAQPDGTVGALPTTGEVVYINNATSFSIADLSAYRFRSEFFAPISGRLEFIYAHDGALNDQDLKYPY